MTQVSSSSIREAARATRAKLGLQDQLVYNFRDFLEKISRAFPKIEVKVVSAAKAPTLAWTDSKTLYVQKSVMEGLTRGDVHARHIIAHELGHLVLHHPSASFRGTARPHERPWQSLEIEAALFANEFLLPTSLPNHYQTANEISDTFRTSGGSASTRIAELISSDELPLAPAIRARTDVISELVDLGYSEAEISALVVPKRTLARRRADDELLTVEETDKALRLSRIAKQSSRVFGDPEKAHRWLRKPKRTLSGETPLAFLASEEGARKVEEMLHQIDHGIAA